MEMLYMRHFFVYTKKYSIQKIFPGELIWWFSIGFIRVGAILDPFSDPLWPNMSDATMKWMHFEVIFLKLPNFHWFYNEFYQISRSFLTQTHILAMSYKVFLRFSDENGCHLLHFLHVPSVLQWNRHFFGHFQ